jgi:hypothetical protein
MSIEHETQIETSFVRSGTALHEASIGAWSFELMQTRNIARLRRFNRLRAQKLRNDFVTMHPDTVHDAEREHDHERE